MGADRGGILGLAATVREHRRPLRADFRRFYHVALDEALSQWTLRELYDLITHLPPDASLWREQGRKDLTELFHEWALTFIQFQSGKKVQTPSAFKEGELGDSVHRPSGAAEVEAALGELLSGPEPGQSGLVVQTE